MERVFYPEFDLFPAIDTGPGLGADLVFVAPLASIHTEFLQIAPIVHSRITTGRAIVAIPWAALGAVVRRLCRRIETLVTRGHH